MTTPRKARKPQIHTTRADVSGAWADESVPREVEGLLANLGPDKRKDALSEIGAALGWYRIRLQGNGPTRAYAIADVRLMAKCADELRQRLDRFPPGAEAEADLILHRQGLPLFTDYRRELAASLRGLESLAVVVERRLQRLPASGAPSAQPRRALYDALAEVAKTYGITFPKIADSAGEFARRAFKAMNIKPPSPDRRTRKN